MGAALEQISKVHNLVAPDGHAALRLDIQFAATGQQDRALFVSVWFTEAEGSKPISSVMRAYADARGKFEPRTAPVTVAVASGRYRADLWVPYGAFPRKSDANSYGVVAHVQLLRRAPDGKVELLDSGTTTFTVHSSP